MYGSLFREWKVAATFVAGIAVVVAIFFSEGGGYEQLELRRKADAPAAAPAPGMKPSQRPRPHTIGGFTPDAELEAEFATPSEAALPSEAAAPAASLQTAASTDTGDTPTAGTADSPPLTQSSASADQLR